ncbi:MAG: hypothetical protein WAK55_21665 [Xanthobacteraceae bacterium]
MTGGMHAEHCAWQASVQIDPKLEDVFGNGGALADAGAQLRVYRTTGDFYDETKRQVNKLPKKA